MFQAPSGILSSLTSGFGRKKRGGRTSPSKRRNQTRRGLLEVLEARNLLAGNVYVDFGSGLNGFGTTVQELQRFGIPLTQTQWAFGPQLNYGNAATALTIHSLSSVVNQKGLVFDQGDVPIDSSIEFEEGQEPVRTSLQKLEVAILNDLARVFTPLGLTITVLNGASARNSYTGDRGIQTILAQNNALLDPNTTTTAPVDPTARGPDIQLSGTSVVKSKDVYILIAGLTVAPGDALRPNAANNPNFQVGQDTSVFGAAEPDQQILITDPEAAFGNLVYSDGGGFVMADTLIDMALAQGWVGTTTSIKNPNAINPDIALATVASQMVATTYNGPASDFLSTFINYNVGQKSDGIASTFNPFFDANIQILSGSEVMREGSNNVATPGTDIQSLYPTLLDVATFSNFFMMNGGANQSTASVSNEYLQWAANPDVGINPLFSYVTGTGANDIITIKVNPADNTTALVTVAPYSSPTFAANTFIPSSVPVDLLNPNSITTAAQPYTFTVKISGVTAVIVDAGRGDDKIIIDPALGVAGSVNVSFRVYGGAGVDDMQIVDTRSGPATANVLVQNLENVVPGTGGIGNPIALNFDRSYDSTIRITNPTINTITINASVPNPVPGAAPPAYIAYEFDDNSILHLENFANLVYQAPPFLGSNTTVVTQVGSSLNAPPATASGNNMVFDGTAGPTPLAKVEGSPNVEFTNIPSVKVTVGDVSANNGVTDDSLTVSARGSVAAGLQSFSMDLGAGNDTFTLDDHASVGALNYTVFPLLLGVQKLNYTTPPVGFNGFFYSDNGLLPLRTNVENVVINGTQGANVFHVTPSTTTTYLINGGAPNAPNPGNEDDLIIDVPGAALVVTGPGAGAYQLAGSKDVNFTGIENIPAFIPISISGRVLNDLTNNGLSADDSPLAGVTVQLFFNGGAIPIASVVSAGDGTYAFSNLGPGTYTVHEVVPVGATLTAPGTTDYTVTNAGVDVTGRDFDNFQNGIAGRVLNDLTGNGRTADDTALPGVTIDLFFNSGGTPIATTTSGADGSYSFTGLASGTYTVVEEVPTGDLLTFGADGYAINVTSGFSANNDFDNFQTFSISGTVLKDLAGDGFSVDDSPLTGWTVNLFRNGGLSPFATAVSNSSGAYTFTNLGPGNYSVQEVVQSGWSLTGGASGYSVPGQSGVNVTGKDFDNFKNVGISGTVRNDLTGNSFSGDDTPLPGWTINLFKNSVFFASAVSGADGTYSFGNLGPATYKVQEVVQAGWTETQGLGGYTIVASNLVNSTSTGNDFDNIHKVLFFTAAADTGTGSKPLVQVFSADGTKQFQFFAFDPLFKGGVQAVADGTNDLLFVSSGAGTGEIKTYHLSTLMSAPTSLVSGVTVVTNPDQYLLNATTVNVTPNGTKTVAVASTAGLKKGQSVFGPGIPQYTTITSVQNGTQLVLSSVIPTGPAISVKIAGFIPEAVATPANPNPSYANGFYLALGHLTGDATEQLVVSRQKGASTVRVFDLSPAGVIGAQRISWAPYAATFINGAVIATGDLNGDGAADVVTGPGAGIVTTVKAYSINPATYASAWKLNTVVPQVQAFASTFKGGVSVAIGDTDGDGLSEVMVGAGAGGGTGIASIVKVFHVSAGFAKGSTLAGGSSTGTGVTQFPTFPTSKAALRIATITPIGSDHALLLVSQGNGGTQQIEAFDPLTGAVDNLFGGAISDTVMTNGLWLS